MELEDQLLKEEHEQETILERMLETETELYELNEKAPKKKP